MLVVKIAESRLTPAVKKKLDALVKLGGDEYTNTLASLACYADDHKNNVDRNWHFINYHFRSDGKPSTNKPLEENVVWAINKFSTILGSKKAPDSEKAIALRYILHFVGDAHQPLHSMAQDTDQFPSGDRGGNDFPVQEIRDWSDRPIKNLHIVWDFACGEYRNVKRPLDQNGEFTLNKMARAFMREFPASSFKQQKEQRPEKWIAESFSFRNFVYSAPRGGALPAAYLEKGRKLCRQRITLAGYRLGDMLNRLLK